MAIASSALLSTCSLPRAHTAHRVASPPNLLPKSDNNSVIPGRRQLLFLLTSSTATLTGNGMRAMAQDIPLFGLRKKLKKAEEEAEEIVKEGIEAAEKGLETAERGIETAEKEIIAVEAEAGFVFGGFAQAGVVAGAEFVGVLVATSVVNGILGPQGQKP
ncbi:uncharacterized protein LOC122079042 [Macadamia integrifolia]|uniref:uncharacterized protein LOC122079042 n=1 Tax=Macadamia integrifolia TaxID=60698 RepID=UPI001C4FB250|nr:uncharacterized protein LOC122079042 [Macadamia integrifolia]